MDTTEMYRLWQAFRVGALDVADLVSAEDDVGGNGQSPSLHTMRPITKCCFSRFARVIKPQALRNWSIQSLNAGIQFRTLSLRGFYQLFGSFTAEAFSSK